MRNGLVLSKDGRKATDLSAEGGADVLRLIGDQLLDARHDLVQEGLTLEERAEALGEVSAMLHFNSVLRVLTRNLSGDRAADLRFCVLQELDKRRDKVAVDHLLINRLCNLHPISIWSHSAYASNEPSQIDPPPCSAPSSSCPRTDFAEQSAERHDLTAAPWELPPRSQ